jgi:hypothetical protein
VANSLSLWVVVVPRIYLFELTNADNRKKKLLINQQAKSLEALAGDTAQIQYNQFDWYFSTRGAIK